MTKLKNIERHLQRIAFVLYASLIIIMGIATFAENSTSAATAKKIIYNSCGSCHYGY
jgi:hypothetical protein